VAGQVWTALRERRLIAGAEAVAHPA